MQALRKISNYITRKVADKLEELFKKDRKSFEEKWDDIRVFIEYGMITEEKFYERAEKFYLFKNIENKYFTLKEYKDHIKKEQTNKDKQLVYLYTSDTEEQHSYIEACKERGYDVLLMDGILDNHFINAFEQKQGDCQFKRVDADIIDKLIESKDELAIKAGRQAKGIFKRDH